jgi:hypothetical protein
MEEKAMRGSKWRGKESERKENGGTQKIVGKGKTRGNENGRRKRIRQTISIKGTDGKGDEEEERERNEEL